MKKLQPTIILLAVLLIGINYSTHGQTNCKPTPDAPANDAKPITTTCTAGKTSQQNPDYSISINGKLNSVSITNENPSGKNMETVNKQTKDSNVIALNGEGNSVNINQTKNAGKVTIQQNGKGPGECYTSKLG